MPVTRNHWIAFLLGISLVGVAPCGGSEPKPLPTPPTTPHVSPKTAPAPSTPAQLATNQPATNQPAQASKKSQALPLTILDIRSLAKLVCGLVGADGSPNVTILDIRSPGQEPHQAGVKEGVYSIKTEEMEIVLQKSKETKLRFYFGNQRLEPVSEKSEAAPKQSQDWIYTFRPHKLPGKFEYPLSVYTDTIDAKRVASPVTVRFSPPQIQESLPSTDSTKLVDVKTWLEPAHFPYPRFRRDHSRIPSEGLLIAEGMTFSYSTSGEYKLVFRASTPVAAELRLQLQIQDENGAWRTLTLPLQHISCTAYHSTNGNGEGEITIEGKSVRLREINEIRAVRRKGVARFGQFPDNDGVSF